MPFFNLPRIFQCQNCHQYFRIKELSQDDYDVRKKISERSLLSHKGTYCEACYQVVLTASESTRPSSVVSLTQPQQQSSYASGLSWGALPFDITHKIFSYLDPYDVFEMRILNRDNYYGVSRYLYKLDQDQLSLVNRIKDDFQIQIQDGCLRDLKTRGIAQRNLADNLTSEQSYFNTAICSVGYTIAFLLENKKIFCWDLHHQNNTTPSQLRTHTFRAIYANHVSFSALTETDEIFCWDVWPGYRADVTCLRPHQKIVGVCTNATAFAGLCADGGLYCWGDPGSGGQTPKLPTHRKIKALCSVNDAFSVLFFDGTVLSWGNGYGVSQPATDHSETAHPTSHAISNYAYLPLPPGIKVEKIYSNHTAFAAILMNGNVILWGQGDVTNSSTTQIVYNYVQLKTCKAISICAGNLKSFAIIVNDASIIFLNHFLSKGVKKKLGNFHHKIKKIYPNRDDFLISLTDDTAYTFCCNSNDTVQPVILPDNKKISFLYPDSTSALLTLENNSRFWHRISPWRIIFNHNHTQIFTMILNDGTLYRLDYARDRTGSMRPGIREAFRIAPNIPDGCRMTGIISNLGASVGILDDHTMTCWGDTRVGAQMPKQLQGLKIYALHALPTAFVAICQNMEIVTWGSTSDRDGLLCPIKTCIFIPNYGYKKIYLPSPLKKSWFLKPSCQARIYQAYEMIKTTLASDYVCSEHSLQKNRLDEILNFLDAEIQRLQGLHLEHHHMFWWQLCNKLEEKIKTFQQTENSVNISNNIQKMLDDLNELICVRAPVHVSSSI